MATIKLIVGLGNPGPKHLLDRHNVGFWFTDLIAARYSLNFKQEVKFKAKLTNLSLQSSEARIMQPQTYMNSSGYSVGMLCKFFKLSSKEILVVHDELDLPCGTSKLKLGGGHGGHNGLRDIISALSTNEFYRLRIGIDHPGHKDAVSNYVLSRPKQDEQQYIEDSIFSSLNTLEKLIKNEININDAMKSINS